MSVRAPDVSVACEWFARCDRPADGVVVHPALEYVPTCNRCAESLGLDLIAGRFVALDDDTVEFRSTVE